MLTLAQLKSASARRRLPHNNGKPHWVTIRPNVALGYRVNSSKPGSWSLRSTINGAKDQWIKRIGLADDREKADGRDVLSYAQAAELAVRLARGTTDAANGDQDRPTTVREAVERYRTHLEQQHGDQYNAARIAGHLPPSILSKPIVLVTGKELEQWRDGLLTKGLSRASVNRLRTCLRAALTLSAKKDRIADRGAWQDLASFPDATQARNIIIDDTTVSKVIAQAYRHDYALGLLTEVLAITAAIAALHNHSMTSPASLLSRDQ
jgi:hypothetical protein